MRKKIIKKLMSVLVLLMLCFPLLQLSSLQAEAAGPSGSWTDGITIVDSTFSGGSGTSIDPYHISSGTDLAQLAYNVNSGTAYSGSYFELTGEIDLSAHYWVPIGNETNSFKGAFDGNRYTISNMTISGTFDGATVSGTGVSYSSPSDAVAGLFGSVNGSDSPTDGTIKNLTVTGTINIINNINYRNIYAGGIIGISGSGRLLENCISGVNITAASTGNNCLEIGGLCGYAWGSVAASFINCQATGTLTTSQAGALNDSGVTYLGGLVGEYFSFAAGQTLVENCSSSASVSGTATNTAYVGGLFGNPGNIKIYNSYATGNVDANSRAVYAGGLVGTVGSNVAINNCYSSGTVTGSGTVTPDFGGFIGSFGSAPTVTNCYWLNSASAVGCYNHTFPGLTAVSSSQLQNTGAIGGSGSYSSLTVIDALNRGAAALDNSNAFIAISGTNNGYPVFSDYTVKFMSDDSPYTLEGSNGGTITAPTAPTRANFSFGGWYLDDTTFNNGWNFASDTVSSDMSLYALWNSVDNTTLLSSVAGQTDSSPGAQSGSDSDDAITWSVNVPISKASLSLTDISAVTNASVKLYTDADFTTEITGSNLLALPAGTVTTAYILVTSPDLITVRYYAVAINRPPSNDAGLTSVLGQTITAGVEAGTSGAPKTASISVANAVSTVAATDIVKHDAGATVTFYGTDSTFTTAEAGSVNLTAGSGTDVYIKIVAADSSTLYYKVSINRASAHSSGGSASSTPTQPTGIEIQVNGKTETVATATTTKQGEQTVTTVVVDDKKIEEKLQAAGSNATVTIPVNNNANVVVGQLNGQTVKNMESKDAVLEIKTQNVTYTLPASQINIDNVSTQIGQQVQLKDIKVNVTIAAPSTDTVKVVEDTANKNKYQVVVKPVEFEITCTSGNKTVEVSKFNGYVERTVAVPDGVDPSKITTGIVLNADGTFSHVPTSIVIIDGKYYAKINSLTNSTYSVIWNPVEFADMNNHWAREAVNDMGSRLVVSGYDKDTYNPDKAITRAEFASIVVKALGLRNPQKIISFSDVSTGSWYYEAVRTAFDYGIISGYADGTFRPNAKITREEAMAMVNKAMTIAKLDTTMTSADAVKQLTAFADGSSVSAWAKQAVAVTIKSGIVNGSNGKLSAKSNVTRAETAVMVRNTLKKADLI